MPLFETSAKDDHKTDHVEAIFVTLAHKIATFTKPMMTNDDKKPILSKDSTKQATTSTSLLRDEDKDSYSCCYVA